MVWDRKREQQVNEYGTEATDTTRWPGKRTLTDSLGAGSRAVVRETRAPDPGAVFESAMEGGRGELPDRVEIERAMGADFSGVRASFGRARELAPIGADAAAYGDRVAFADARPSREVVAHELAHVAQFRNSGVGAGSPRAISSPDDAAERAAWRGDASGGAPDALHLATGKLKQPFQTLKVGAEVEIVERLPNDKVKIKWTDGDGEHVGEIDADAIEEIEPVEPVEPVEQTPALPDEVAEALKSMDHFAFAKYLYANDKIAKQLMRIPEKVNADLDRLRNAVIGYSDLSMDAESSKDWMKPLMPKPIEAQKKLAKGLMKWSFKGSSAHAAAIEIQFEPKEGVNAKAIGFVQTVIQRLGDDPLYDILNVLRPGRVKNEFQDFAEAQKGSYVDPYDHKSRSSPFYGADWSSKPQSPQSTDPLGWIGHDKAHVGQSGQAATMNDRPATSTPRLVDKPYQVTFESAAMVLETLEPLGVLRWGFKIEGRDKPLELIGATDGDCTDAPSKELDAAVAKHYSTKFVMCDEFEENGDAVPKKHEDALKELAGNLKQYANYTAVLGGAADQGEASAQALSQRRAEAVKRFLVDNGAPEGQLRVEAYGDQWARVRADGQPKPQNRRVQIRPYEEDDLPKQHQTGEKKPALVRFERKPREEQPKAATPKVEKAHTRKATVTVVFTEDGYAVCTVVDGTEAEAEVIQGQAHTFEVFIPDGEDEVRLTICLGETGSTHTWKVAEPLTAKGANHEVTAKL